MGIVGALALVALLAYAMVWWDGKRRSREGPGGLAVAASPAEAVDAATAYMVQNGYAISHKGDTSATFTRPKKPNNDIGCLLLLLGVLPGLLYFGLSQGVYTTTIVATREPGETRLVLSGDDAKAHRDLSRWTQDA